VFNLLLQLLDEGRLTDNKGRTVNFKNTIVIMTSNLGSHLIQEKLGSLNGANGANGENERVYNALRSELFELLRQTIRPEFLNRIDEVILFKVLSRDDLLKVVELQLRRVRAMLAEKKITLEISREAKEWIGKLGYDPTLGARPLKRVIQKHVVNELSTKLLAGEIADGDTVRVGLDKQGLIEIVRDDSSQAGSGTPSRKRQVGSGTPSR
jgi:ATP-dependent Clp protease ATP-binding subunit ClpB